MDHDQQSTLNKVAHWLMGLSIFGWLADHGMVLLSAAGIVVSIVIQVLSYRLRRDEVRAKLKGHPG